MALTKIKQDGLTADIIDETKLADDSIDSEHYNAGSIDAAHIANNTITATQLATDCISGSQLADNAINSEHYTDGSIDHEHLANDCVDSDNIADNSVGLPALANMGRGALLTGDASGNPKHVAAGSDNNVLTMDANGDFGWEAASGGLSNIVEDTSPQLGGNLDTNSFEISLDDDHKVNFGDSAEFKIYYDGSNAQVENSGGGDLMLKAKAGEHSIRCVADGTVELYHNHIKQVETNANGILLEDDHRVTFGDSNDGDLRFKSSSNQLELTVGNAQNFQLNLGGEVGGKAICNGAIELYYDNSKKFETTSTGVGLSGTLTRGNGIIDIYDSNTDTVITNGVTNGDIVFNAVVSGQGTVPVLRLGNGDASGAVLIPNDFGKLKLGAGSDLQLYHNGSNSIISHNGGGDLLINTAAGEKIYFDSAEFNFRNAASNETLIKATENGAVELYHNNAKKLETASGGGTLTGAWTTGTGYALKAVATADTVTTWNITETSYQTDSNISVAASNYKHGDILVLEASFPSSFIINTENQPNALRMDIRIEGSDGTNTGYSDMTANYVRMDTINSKEFCLYAHIHHIIGSGNTTFSNDSTVTFKFQQKRGSTTGSISSSGTGNYDDRRVLRLYHFRKEI